MLPKLRTFLTTAAFILALPTISFGAGLVTYRWNQPNACSDVLTWDQGTGYYIHDDSLGRSCTQADLDAAGNMTFAEFATLFPDLAKQSYYYSFLAVPGLALPPNSPGAAPDPCAGFNNCGPAPATTTTTTNTANPFGCSDALIWDPESASYVHDDSLGRPCTPADATAAGSITFAAFEALFPDLAKQSAYFYSPETNPYYSPAISVNGVSDPQTGAPVIPSGSATLQQSADSAAPEPATCLTFACGLFALSLTLRRRQSHIR